MIGYDYHVTDSYGEGEIQPELHKAAERQARAGNYDTAGLLESASQMCDHLESELEKRDAAIAQLLERLDEANARANQAEDDLYWAEGKIYELEETIDGRHHD